MPRHFVFNAIALLTCPRGFAQGVASVDLLNPEETSGTIPAHFRIVDVFVDVALTDEWTAAGIRATTENGASFNYFDSEPNTPGLQPGLINGGAANRFFTMLSKPRGREASNRFNNGMAATAGSYDPVGPTPLTAQSELNVAYFAYFEPPDLQKDGYIARISVDISAVPEIPGFPIGDYTNWGAGPTIPPGALVVLRSEPFQQQFGTVIATFDEPGLGGLNWALYYVPEPASAAALTIGGLGVVLRRREVPGARWTS